MFEGTCGVKRHCLTLGMGKMLNTAIPDIVNLHLKFNFNVKRSMYILIK